MKKSLSIFLVIAMLLSMCTVVGAEDIIINVLGSSYTAGTPQPGTDDAVKIYVSGSYPNAYFAEYQVEVLVAGMYNLTTNQKLDPGSENVLNVYVDNALAVTKTYTQSREWNWTKNEIGEIPLNEGTNIIKLEVPKDGVLELKDFTLERTGDLPEAPAPAMVITAGGADITESKQLADAFSGAVEVTYTPVDANPYFVIVAYYEGSEMINSAIATVSEGVYTATLSGVTKGANNRVKVFLWDTEANLTPYGAATEIR